MPGVSAAATAVFGTSDSRSLRVVRGLGGSIAGDLSSNEHKHPRSTAYTCDFPGGHGEL